MPTAAAGARAFRPVQKAALPRTPAPLPRAPVTTKAPEKAPEKRRRSVADWLILLAGGAVILCGIAALIIWQTDILDVPWIHDLIEPAPNEPAANPLPKTTPQAAAPDRRSPMPAAPAETKSNSAAAPPRASIQPESTAPAATVEHVSQPNEPVTNQDVEVLTDPAGATATLDGSSDLTCRTPCKLPARTGTHSITLMLSGYQPERREILVGHQDTELALVSMRAANGVLMLTSDPSGLSVIVDGRATGYQTPVRMTLPAGPHNVSVDRSGTQASGAIEIRNGDLTALKLIVR